MLRSFFPAENRLSLTSRELIELAQGGLPEETLCSVAALFDRCDWVRFGGGAPGKGDAAAALDDALAAVRKLVEGRR